MCQFISKDRLEKNVERLNTVYLQVLKREGKTTVLRPLFEGFNKYLDRLYCIDRQYYENSVKSVSVSLYEFYKNPIFSPNYPFDQANLKYKNDLYSVLQTVSQFNIDNSLDLFIGRINVRNLMSLTLFSQKNRSRESPAFGCVISLSVGISIRSLSLTRSNSCSRS